MSYRRHHELLPSVYNQRYKLFRNNSKLTPGHHHWPGVRGDVRIPSFPEVLSTLIEEEDISVRSYDAWSKFFPVSIFNTHQEGDLVTNFVCQVVTGARQLCRIFADDSNEASNTSINKSTSYLDWDILGVFAHEQGLVHELDNRYKLAKAIGAYIRRSNLRLPLACPTKETIDQLYRTSMKIELWATSFGSPKPLTNFQTSWEETLQKMKLCSVNASSALEQEVWKNFFQQRMSSIDFRETNATAELLNLSSNITHQ
ncbi:unnamed protein product [Pseudo-nitzschia multistriata]|uniref:Uncharacterized protein n=1 Tax=Pseudo-nitzschia multistriata TaxID=183589 RepID=A0A448ZFG5_9STRA|nr:unnamed protein product [Pseudo-nitzschia multistriata]